MKTLMQLTFSTITNNDTTNTLIQSPGELPLVYMLRSENVRSKYFQF